MEMIYIYYGCTFWTEFNQVKYLELVYSVADISIFQHYVILHDKATYVVFFQTTNKKYFYNIQDKINHKPWTNRIDHAILTVLIV